MNVNSKTLKHQQAESIVLFFNVMRILSADLIIHEGKLRMKLKCTVSATLVMSCLLMPVAFAKEASAPKHVKSAGQSAPATAEKTDNKKVSYGIGVDIGRNFKRLGLDLDLDVLTKGLKDANTGKKLDLSEDELRTVMSAYKTEMMQKQAEAVKSIGATNQKAGEVFLAENAKKDGVVTLPSGLQYKIVKQGDGKMPTEVDTVECNYRGTLIDGIEFDSSARTGKPAQFKLGGVIPGWQEALKLMPVGSKWQLFIPPQLAYGQRGAGRDIGPNATLVFEVELISIKADEAKPSKT
jgi:FKBP-type peptidyl-prolyl cis-trans isomerase FklB